MRYIYRFWHILEGGIRPDWQPHQLMCRSRLRFCARLPLSYLKITSLDHDFSESRSWVNLGLVRSVTSWPCTAVYLTQIIYIVNLLRKATLGCQNSVAELVMPLLRVVSGAVSYSRGARQILLNSAILLLPVSAHHCTY